MLYNIKDFTKELNIYNTVDFKKLKDFDYYYIYEDGRVFSIKRNVFLQLQDYYGYKRIALLNNDKKRKAFFVHRLVYETFKGPIPEKLQVDHINGIRDDNRLINLRLLTHKENNQNHHHLEQYKEIEKEKYIKNKEKKKEYYDNNKEAIKERLKNYYDKNKDIIIERTKINYEKNKENRKKYNKDYYEKHKDQMREYCKKYSEKHKEQIKEYNKEYRNNHKEELLDYGRKYRENNREEINKKRRKSNNNDEETKNKF